MFVGRREFLHWSTRTAGASLITGLIGTGAEELGAGAFQQLRPLSGQTAPITDDERRARIAKAQRLMVENKIDAIYLEGGSSLFYFTGVRWGNSERMFAAVIPAKGEIAQISWITPKFEEARARELIRFGKDIRAWEEDESPYRVVAGIFKDRGIRTGRIGMEERVRFFLFDGIRQEAKQLEYTSADPVTAGCRMIKSPAEIALLQRANDITLEAFKNAAATLKEGMTQFEFGAQVRAAFSALGSSGSALIGFGEYTAFPHGSIQPQKLKVGDVVLMDGGCAVEGYQADITRTFVFGKPTPRQRDIWNLERKAQDAAFAAAKPGATCEAVDAAARKVITDAGFGPDYQVPGLPHRTGHGIGLDGHEWTNFVRGNKTKLLPGMCFSDEPMIAIYGEFGIRLEDCLYITEDGARFFTKQSASIDQPFG
ncbi:MAG: aminopeptidase P family protein [Acidobacteria bacterium]|nr:aminopeptidase P family protein [Acidobacteriota bacterium]